MKTATVDEILYHKADHWKWFVLLQYSTFQFFFLGGGVQYEKKNEI